VPEDGNVEGVSAPALPAEPQAPGAALLEPCRAGWVAVDGACEPFPSPPPTCGADEALFPGDVACAPIGGPCPAGDWATDLPASGVLYVRDGASPGGDGSLGRPFDRIQPAVDAAIAGATVAIARGSYVEAITLRSGVTLRGACVAGTRLSFSVAHDSAGVITVTGPGARVEGVAIEGLRPGVWVEGTGASVHLEDVLIRSARLVGWAVAGGATATGRNVVVRDMLGSAIDGALGRGISLEDRATLTLERSVVERTRDVGVFAIDRSHIALTDVAVRETREYTDFGDALGAAYSSILEGTGVVLEDNVGAGAYVTQPGSEIRLTDSVVRRNEGEGIQASVGGFVGLTRSRIEDNGLSGAIIDGGGTRAELDHVWIRRNGSRAIADQNGATVVARHVLFSDNLATSVFVAGDVGEPMSSLELSDARVEGNVGKAMLVQLGGTAAVARAIFSRNVGTGIVLRDGVVVTLEDVAVLDTPSEPDGSFGRGMEIRLGSDVTATRLTLERNHELGLFVEDATARLADVVIRDTESRPDQELGRGLEVQMGSHVTLERALLEGNRGVGLFAGSGSTVTASDVTSRNTRGSGAIALGGHGLTVNGAASVILSRGRFEDNREVSIAVFEAGTTADLSDVVVTRTLVRDCAMDTCAGYGGGIGIGSYLAGQVTVRRFSVSRSALCGVQLGGGAMDLFEGEIVDNPVGANVQTPGFDFSRLTTGVEFRDNERNVDTTELPVPVATDPAGP